MGFDCVKPVGSSPGKPSTPAPGFLGSTSFSAVYAEKGLEGLRPTLSEHISSIPDDHQPLYAPDRDSQIAKGVVCLQLIEDLPLFELLMEQWRKPSPISMMNHLIIPCLRSLKTELYDKLLNAEPGLWGQMLTQYSKLLFKNSLKPIVTSRNSTIEQYAEQFTGENLRWEAVGIFFTSVGLAACTIANLKATKPGVSSLEQRQRLAKRMLEAADVCLSFFEEIGQLSDAETWFATESAHLSTLVEGDASYIAWERTGSLISKIIAKGLHMEIQVDANTPFWLSEMRKQTFAITYSMDKDLSSFTGRPPRLLRKYCSMQLPLDMKQERTTLPEDLLVEELDKLDEHGWNTMNAFLPTTYVRSWLISNMITEDILEFLLTSLPHEDEVVTARNIIRRLESSWETLPEFIRKSSMLRSNFADEYIPEAPVLDHRHNYFLLQRALVSKGHETNEELLRVSSEQLKTVLAMTRREKTTVQYACDIPWIMAKYALPTAGVLGIELLRESQGITKLLPSFSRSNVVQDLSGLVAALKWMVPRLQGDFEICDQARRVLQRILNLVLDPGAYRHTKNTGAESSAQDNQIGADHHSWLMISNGGSEPDFWFSLPDHPLLTGRSEWEKKGRTLECP